MRLPDAFDQATADLITEYLPASVLEFARVIGLESSITLCRELGGVNIRIPVRESSRVAQHLIRVVGREKALLMMSEFGGTGEEFFIPRCSQAIRILRNREIVGAFDRLTMEMSSQDAVTELSIKYRLTYRQIENIVSSSATDTRNTLKRSA